MDKHKVSEILLALAEGVNPSTGEIYPNDSPYNNPDIIRALFYARDAIINISLDESNSESKKITAVNDDEIGLFEKLKKWRSAVAKAKSIKSYIIASDKSLYDLVRKKPSTLLEIKNVYGFRDTNVDLYGEEILDIISEHYSGRIPCNKENMTNNQKVPNVGKKPERSGYPWTNEEDNTLRQEYLETSNISKIAIKHQRTSGSIQSRLQKLGLIEL